MQCLSLSSPEINPCPAKSLTLNQRSELALSTLQRKQPLTKIAEQHQVSRPFLYRQQNIAVEAVKNAFVEESPPEVLFSLPVTKAWLEQATLVLLLNCHSSYRGVLRFFETLLHTKRSLGWIHNLVAQTIEKVNILEEQEQLYLQSLHSVTFDEIFQGGHPVLVGVDLDSSYCFLLEQTEKRDQKTWARSLQCLKEKGCLPSEALTDAGKGLCAGLFEVFPGMKRGDDHFHRLRDFGVLVRELENRAYRKIEQEHTLSRKMNKPSLKDRRAFSRKIGHVRMQMSTAISLADDLRTLYLWLRDEIFAPDLKTFAEREELMNFVLEELLKRKNKSAKLSKLVNTLTRQKAELMHFAKKREERLNSLAEEEGLSFEELNECFGLLCKTKPKVARLAEVLVKQCLGKEKTENLRQKLEEIERTTYRASSWVENVNSRLRRYFFLRKQAGKGFCTLLRFFLNHEKYGRSLHPERVGKSPFELLSGMSQSHWLERLGYKLFRQTV